MNLKCICEWCRHVRKMLLQILGQCFTAILTKFSCSILHRSFVHITSTAPESTTLNNDFELVTYWVSATEDTVLVQSRTKALVHTATSITVLPCEEEAKTSHDGVVPLTRELF